MGTVYLLHFDKPLAHAQHYVGFTKRESPLRRLKVHRAGQGARLTQVLNIEGITYRVARIWRNASRAFERQLKNRNGCRCFCPLCRPDLKKFKYRRWRA
ncbi:endonuclease [Hymenobacter sp. M29]|uniref:Endonuclease n=1 Tax=Hymenobacter mellowenesis TaxID=3063995 RepID=A0ABT9AAQ8_9BACT|nr:endonuclease [Hymenobacter sp. M29]MDO7846454.1 endonuclease [Hymenobacter sp. M29]